MGAGQSSSSGSDAQMLDLVSLLMGTPNQQKKLDVNDVMQMLQRGDKVFDIVADSDVDSATIINAVIKNEFISLGMNSTSSSNDSDDDSATNTVQVDLAALCAQIQAKNDEILPTIESARKFVRIANEAISKMNPTHGVQMQIAIATKSLQTSSYDDASGTKPIISLPDRVIMLKPGCIQPPKIRAVKIDGADLQDLQREDWFVIDAWSSVPKTSEWTDFARRSAHCMAKYASEELNAVTVASFTRPTNLQLINKKMQVMVREGKIDESMIVVMTCGPICDLGVHVHPFAILECTRDVCRQFEEFIVMNRTEPSSDLPIHSIWTTNKYVEPVAATPVDDDDTSVPIDKPVQSDPYVAAIAAVATTVDSDGDDE